MNLSPQLIRRNKYSRPGKSCDVKAIAIHWTADPGATAKNIRDYFDNLGKQHDGQKGNRSASAHYAIDRHGIIQMIPDNEMAYHVGAHKYTEMAKANYMPYPNMFILGIEMCHDEEDGIFHIDTINHTIDLCANLCNKYDLNPIYDIVRHFDITGKICPKFYVENEKEFDKLKRRIRRHARSL